MFKKIKKYFQLFGVINLGVFFLNNKVLAQRGPITDGITLTNPLGENSIIKIISNILDWLIIYSIPILALMILIGGFQILMAKDSADKVKNGSQTIKYAVIGFAIILISKGVALLLLNILE